MLIVGSVVIRVDDLAEQIRFWSAALNYSVREPIDEDFALLEPTDGSGPNVSLDAHPSERILPPRIHLDLYAQDQAAEVGRLLGLGATPVPWDKRPPDADYVIMQDPEGNRFCVIDATGWPGWRQRRRPSAEGTSS
ncbi:MULTISPECIES: VOC family protein [unclassified Microbacterium]|uniref:VOC family protein n=1 Tax=unclassified Microbacterium TaxID=2609290 RepID=UPI00214AF1F9|nr:MULTISPECIES: VOC family protein [unclassified Microbacterium]MCR2810322.1 VOC family protein [Microbacterium sp. zg.B185]WIM18381.1 VOC family protein [Microbacterium sp. zg-B185]